MAEEKKQETCPTCGAYMRTGIPVQYDGMRILFQWEGRVLSQRFTFDPGVREESMSDLPRVFRYIHQIVGMWEQWIQNEFKSRDRRKVIVPGATLPKIIKGEMQIDTERDP